MVSAQVSLKVEETAKASLQRQQPVSLRISQGWEGKGIIAGHWLSAATVVDFQLQSLISATAKACRQRRKLQPEMVLYEKLRLHRAFLARRSAEQGCYVYLTKQRHAQPLPLLAFRRMVISSLREAGRLTRLLLPLCVSLVPESSEVCGSCRHIADDNEVVYLNA